MASASELLKALPDAKSKRVCWGCNMLEPADKPFKNQCTRCKHEGFVPALFCSKTCYKQAWPQHKEWHETSHTGKQKLQENFEIHLATTPAPDSEYCILLQQAGKILGTGDLNRAKKIYRKAQKLDPRRPEAFQNVSACFVHSGQCEEARYYMQEAVKRYAFAALIGYRGDRKLHESEITQVIGDWASDLFILSEGYDSKNEEGNRSPPPNWWLQDGMFKRITKVALNTAMACIKDPNLHCKDPQEHRRHILMWSAWRVRTLTRFLSQDHDATLPLSRTAEEFREVAELCLFLSANVNAKGEEKDGSVLDEEGINSLLAGGISATVCSAAAENTSEGSALQRGEAGLWVVIHGLCSPSETAMNNQFALVCLDGLEDGRVAVKVDGISETKRILACNLWEVPFSETKVALISTLEDAIQWQFVRGSRELALARVMAGRN